MSEGTITISIDRVENGRLCYVCRICNEAIEGVAPEIRPSPIICEECAGRIKKMIYPEGK